MADFPLEFLLQVKNEMSSGINQATSQLKGLGDTAKSSGDKVKQSGIGIGAGIALITTNLVNTANSIIGLNRQYQDLKRQQDNVTQSGFSLANAQGKLENATITLKSAMKGKEGASKEEIKIAQLQFKEDMKNAKSKLDVMKAHEKLNKVLKKGGTDTDKIAKAQNNYERATRGVKSALINQHEAQVNLERATQDFYLSTIPTAIGVFGSFASVLQVVQGGGGLGGLASSFLKFSPILIGVGAAFAALSTNFLGITTFFQNLGRDIGNAIPELRPFLSLVESLFATIGIGDKSKAKGLNNLAKQFIDSFKPITDFFKGIVDKIMHGDWSGVFNAIRTAAVNFWGWLKKAIPFLGDVEKFIGDIAAAKWDDVFNSIKNAAITFWNDLKTAVPFFAGAEIFFKQLFSGDAEGALRTATAGIRGVIDSIFGKTAVDNFITQITQIPEKIKAIWNMPNQSTGQKIWNIIDALLPTSVKQFAAQIGKFAYDFGVEVVNQLMKALTGLAHIAIDPFIASLFDPNTWIAAFTAVKDTIIAAGQGIVNAIALVIGNPDEAGKAATSFLEGLSAWLNANFPKSVKAATDFINNLGQAFSQIPNAIKTAAQALWNNLIKAIKEFFTPNRMKDAVVQLANSIGQAVDKNSGLFKAIGNAIGGYIVSTIPSWLIAIPGSPLAKSIENYKKQISPHASGFHGYVSGGQLMSAGERGIEKVDITPMSDIINRRQSNGGGGWNGSITVYSVLDGQIIAESVARRISTNQAVYR